MTTRDGVTLRADVYRPDAPGRHPVLLSRLPYDKTLRRRPGDVDIFVEQDTQGSPRIPQNPGQPAHQRVTIARCDHGPSTQH
ncbi:MAG TPA: CocE/NonD family hydrolase, partial [Methylomirabilota bacterium]|nr:CocE/NonD family hydrolase [Methylomirabilota bacterium]